MVFTLLHFARKKRLFIIFFMDFCGHYSVQYFYKYSKKEMFCIAHISVYRIIFQSRYNV